MPQEKKIVLTPELRRIWLNVRNAWNMNLTAFSNSVSALDQKQAEALYELVRVSLFKGSHAEILRNHPELRPILRSDEDRLCMHDIYEKLSWKLGKKEPEPPELSLARKMKSRIGRGVADLSG